MCGKLVAVAGESRTCPVTQRNPGGTQLTHLKPSCRHAGQEGESEHVYWAC